MPSLIIPNAFQVSIQAHVGTQIVENVIGVQKVGGSAEAAALAVQSAWEGSGKPINDLTTLYVMDNYHAVDLSSEFGDIFDLPSTTTGNQSSPNVIATMAASALVQWNGASRSRSTRGRLYFGPLREADINADGRTLDATVHTAFQSAFDAFIGQLSAAGYPLAVLSRKLSQAFVVGNASVETVIATQRRRLR